jgi:hypothetical protein
MVLEKAGDQLERSCINEEVLERVQEQKNVLHTIKRKANWIGHILRRNCVLKQIVERKVEGTIEVREDEGEDTSSCWMTSWKRDGTGSWRIALCRELALEEAMDLSENRLRNERKKERKKE